MTGHEQHKKNRLFCDLKTDEEKAAFFLSGRGTAMTDIVERLRSLSEGRIPLAWSGWVLEAADQIEGLRDEIRNAYRERDEASQDWEQAMRRVTELEQQLASRAVPDGWRLVPVEPTMDMLCAAREADTEYQRRMGLPDTVGVGAYDHYVAMLAAAPQPDRGNPITEPATPAEDIDQTALDLAKKVWAIGNRHGPDTQRKAEIQVALADSLRALAQLGAAPEHNGWYCAQCERGPLGG